MSKEILKADPGYRKRTMLIITGMLIAGCLVIAFLLPWLKSYMLTLGCRKASQLLFAIFAVAFIVPLLLSFHIIRTGVKSLREERFPPTGTKVIKDTVLLTGKEARNRGKILIFLAGFIMALSITGMTLIIFIVVRFV
jgi:hypothetical protein